MIAGHYPAVGVACTVANRVGFGFDDTSADQARGRLSHHYFADQTARECNRIERQLGPGEKPVGRRFFAAHHPACLFNAVSKECCTNPYSKYRCAVLLQGYGLLQGRNPYATPSFRSIRNSRYNSL